MDAGVFLKRTQIPVPAAEAFAWHLRPGAFERLTPPWEDVRLVSRTGDVTNGGRVELSVPIGPIRRRWVAEHRGFEPGRRFQDVQLAGPFARWEHTHTVEPAGPSACVLEDRIEYRLPLGAVGSWLGGAAIRHKLDVMFAYRHAVTAADLTQNHQPQVTPMRILISGATGLVGRTLTPLLTTAGHTVVPLSRKPSRSDSPAIVWDPQAGRLDAGELEGFDAVIHLAGEGIADRRWSDAQKARIRDSRVKGTRLLAETLAGLRQKPQALLCASAIGYYGDRGDEVCTEESAAGTGFLAEVCQAWESACQPARDAGLRVVNLRLGIVLSPAGGALAQMLTPFRMGVGGKLGSGRQYMSWVSLDDTVGAFHHALQHAELGGPVNVVAPEPVTNAEFTRTLGKVLSRPTIFPVPAFAARLAFGEMADALLLAGTRVVPTRLLQSGYAFRHSRLEDALRHQLGRPATRAA